MGFKASMVFQTPGISRDTILKTLFDKYNYPIVEDDIYVFSEIEQLIACPDSTIIVCDGNFHSLADYGIKIIAKKIYGFGCGRVEYPPIEYKDAIYLADERVYPETPGGTISYTKKIFRDILRHPTIVSDVSKTGMMYLTKNCRDFPKEAVQEVFRKINLETLLIVTPVPDEYRGLGESIIPVKPPVQNLFSMFGTYIYTPVPRKFDCSPRLVAECSLFNKEVLYWDINYEDIGLQTRIQDIESGNVWLKEDDEIIRILELSKRHRDLYERR